MTTIVGTCHIADGIKSPAIIITSDFVSWYVHNSQHITCWQLQFNGQFSITVAVAGALKEAAGAALPAFLFSLSILSRPSKRYLQRWSWYQPWCASSRVCTHTQMPSRHGARAGATAALFAHTHTDTLKHGSSADAAAAVTVFAHTLYSNTIYMMKWQQPLCHSSIVSTHSCKPYRSDTSHDAKMRWCVHTHRPLWGSYITEKRRVISDRWYA